MELRIRPKSTFLEDADWQQLFVLTEYWQHDSRFYEDELRFLRNLVDKYFIWLVREENLNKVQAVAKKLTEADHKHKELSSSIDKHLSYLAGIMKDPSAHNIGSFRSEHAELEDELAGFNKLMREVKRDVFALTEHVMETEKLQHLLSS